MPDLLERYPMKGKWSCTEVVVVGNLFCQGTTSTPPMLSNRVMSSAGDIAYRQCRRHSLQTMHKQKTSGKMQKQVKPQ